MNKKEIEFFGQMLGSSDITLSSLRALVFDKFPKVKAEADSWNDFDKIEAWAEEEPTRLMDEKYGAIWICKPSLKQEYQRICAEVEEERKRKHGL